VNPREKLTLGKTDVELTRFGFGGGSIGELFIRVSEKAAESTLETTWNCGARYCDRMLPFPQAIKMDLISIHRAGCGTNFILLTLQETLTDLSPQASNRKRVRGQSQSLQWIDANIAIGLKGFILYHVRIC